MELIALIAVFVTGLASFGLLADRFGADSRESFDQDPTRTFTVRFV